MLSKTLQEIPYEASEIRNFYTGKTVFITGATGFLGTVLLEALLRCCPGISKIYILLRSKEDVSIDDRKNLIFKKDIFNKLKETNPDVLKKVTALSGDVAQDNLGLNENAYNTLTKEVSVVFHVAASISFTKPLSFIIRQNVIATNSMLQLCRKMEKLEVLVYTSSAFSNCNQKYIIEEKIYDLPFSPEEVVKLGRDNDEDELMKLYNMCNPPFPNFYTFSKCVAENLLKKNANGMPVCIIRPSLIFGCLKGPLPGYFENGSALAYLSALVGKGFIRVVQVDKDKRLEIIPADVTANAHIVAACHQVSRSLPSLSVYNCVSGELATFTWGDYMERMLSMTKKYPLPQSYLHPTITCCKNPRMYTFLSLLLHYLPVATIDLFLWISGSKFRLMHQYKYFDKAMKTVEFFTMNDWEMRNKNFQLLSKGIDTVEEELFCMDLKDFTFDEMARTIPTGAVAYRPNGKPYKEGFTMKCQRNFLTILFVLFFLQLTIVISKLIFSKILIRTVF